MKVKLHLGDQDHQVFFQKTSVQISKFSKNFYEI